MEQEGVAKCRYCGKSINLMKESSGMEVVHRGRVSYIERFHDKCMFDFWGKE